MRREAKKAEAKMKKKEAKMEKKMAMDVEE